LGNTERVAAESCSALERHRNVVGLASFNQQKEENEFGAPNPRYHLGNATFIDRVNKHERGATSFSISSGIPLHRRVESE
jgi:hypothetical protein